MERTALIVQVPEGSSVEAALRREPPVGVVVESLPAGPDGRLDAPDAGEVVLSVLGPEGLARDAETLRRVIDEAGTGSDPLVVVVEAAEELREDELAPVVEAAGRSRRPVIVRVEAGV